MKRRSSGIGRALVGYGFAWGAVIGAALLAAAFLSGCTKPIPAPNHPDAADASPALVRSCDSACQVACEKAAAHAETIATGAGAPAGAACNRIADPAFTACVAGAATKDALNACGGPR